MKKYLLLLLIVMLQTGLHARQGWYLTSFLGGSYSLPSGINFNMVGEDNFTHNADWEGHSTWDSPYYVTRADYRYGKNKGWGVEWVHHKAYVGNVDSRLQDFSISDGFNLLYYNRLRDFNSGILKDYKGRFGVGLVFGNPDVTIAGREQFFNEGGVNGTYLSGITAQVALERWLWESDRFFISAETKFTASYARVPISPSGNEYADTQNYAFHFVIGLGSKPLQAEDRNLKGYATYFAFPGISQFLAFI